MGLEETILQIQDKLRRGLFPDEAAVCQGAVLRILQELGWPVFDTTVVHPQYPVETRKIDYALCRANGKPVVFIEVKRVGVAASGERQLFEYAFHSGVPLAVLTDGQEWNFYLPAGEGDYQDRRVYKLDLLERDLSECSYRLNRYLSHLDVSSGMASENAQSDYRDVNREREIERILPQAWNTLLNEADDLLVELLSDKVSDLCGYKPDQDACVSFLLSKAASIGTTIRKSPAPVHSSPHEDVANKPTGMFHQPRKPRQADRVGFVVRGQSFECRNPTDVMISIFEKLRKL